MMICKIIGHKLFEIRTQEQVHPQMFSVLACQRCGVAKAIASPNGPYWKRKAQV